MQECKGLAEHARTKTNILFAVDTLEYLHRGGRIGDTATLLGTALSIKPILELIDRRVEAVDRVRTKSKAKKRLLELLEQKIQGHTPIHLAGIHANAPEEVKDPLEIVKTRIDERDISQMICIEATPVIGNHTGPGAIGFGYMGRL